MSSIVSIGCILRLGPSDKTLFAAVLDCPCSAFVSPVFWFPLPLPLLVTYWASVAFILTGNMFHSVLDWRFSECVGENPGLGCDILLLGECFPLFLRIIVPFKHQELLDVVSHPIRRGNSRFISLTSPVLCSSNCKIPVTSFVKTLHINHFSLPYMQCSKDSFTSHIKIGLVTRILLSTVRPIHT
jgi:hypothetical protein